MKKNDSRAIARLKRMYKEFKDNLFIKDDKGWRPCESITEFLELKWVKRHKNTSSFGKHPLDKLDAKLKNKRERISKRDQINEGVEEYEMRFDDGFYCYECVHFNGQCTCTLHNESTWKYNQACEDCFI